jgi:hypothetical protein
LGAGGGKYALHHNYPMQRSADTKHVKFPHGGCAPADAGRYAAQMRMRGNRNTFLIIGAALSALAALLHVGCILFGASWYRFFGAGERMARMAAAGHWYPTVITSGIVAILFCWSLYALSGAGVVRRLPLMRLVLCIIAGIYMLRAVAFAPFHRYFPGNSAAFWLWSSAICFVIGLVHLVGLWQAWPRLRPPAA